jgi:(1->4)-alpha-D-glucan 1-alpha-D-glucosylmutase
MSPGTPDTYQGDDCWSFALVDPDNRRPVDYGTRAELLRSQGSFAGGVSTAELFDSRAKQHIVNQLLTLRRERAELFMKGNYTPLTAHGPRSQHVVAFARTFGETHIVTVVPRLVGEWIAAGRPAEWWGDTSVELPLNFAGTKLRSRLTEQDVVPSHGRLALATLFHTIPVAVLAD